MVSTMPPGRTADRAPVSCLATIGAAYDYARATGLKDYFSPALQEVLKRSSIVRAPVSGLPPRHSVAGDRRSASRTTVGGPAAVFPRCWLSHSDALSIFYQARTALAGLPKAH